jgi:hypothetical protein
VILAPPEGATEAEIERMSAEAARRLPPGSQLIVGRCWLDMLARAVGGSDEPDA